GSGLSQEAGSVEQLSLHCAEGSLEWLYPTGALRLRLDPRLPPTTATIKGRSPRHVTACVKPSGTFRGAQLYLEREGVLELLLPEAPRPRVRCFSWLPREKVALFLQATPHRDISRRIAAFRYELRGDWLARPALPATSLTGEGACRPCNDTEILMAICTSDFGECSPPRVLGGSWGPGGGKESQTGGATAPQTALASSSWTGLAWAAAITWLSCAPRYRDFQRIYEGARRTRQNPCEFPVD
ncbi:METRN protein, partial [Dromas ardeola]|nr:METRN protein [Dromas ardeola]